MSRHQHNRVVRIMIMAMGIKWVWCIWNQNAVEIINKAAPSETVRGQGLIDTR